MYLLDTNVISELRKAKSGKANKHVVTWAKKVSPSSLFLSAMTIVEIETGILKVEQKHPLQGVSLRAWLKTHVLPTFSGRILPIDTAVALCCARLHVPDPKSDRDVFIAATALVHGMIVVTRNIGDFDKTGVGLLNPWE